MSVSLKNISKRFGGVEALKRIDLEIRDGEFFAILGPSGCGKTTLLRIISGLEKPTTGRVFFDNEDVTDLPAEYRDVSMVFQFYALYPATVYDNIALPLKSRGYPRNRVDEAVREAARLVGIEDKLGVNVDRLNVADKQRVALARAIARRPKLYLFDEPLTILDPVSRIIMRSEIKRLQRELRQTIIYVTHDQIEALTLADRVAVMNFGVVEQVGSPLEIYSKPVNTYVGWFLGEPGMNFVEAEVGEEELRIGDQVIYRNAELASMLRANGYEEVLLGFRAEDVAVSRGSVSNSAEHFVLNPVVDTIEFFGTHYILSLKIDTQEFRAKLSTRDYMVISVREGDRIFAAIKRTRVNLYDVNKRSLIKVGDAL